MDKDVKKAVLFKNTKTEEVGVAYVEDQKGDLSEIYVWVGLKFCWWPKDECKWVGYYV